jgi:large subunit ribosomal protein L6
MSRIGKLPIKIPEKVTVKLQNGFLLVEGPLGKLERDIHSLVKVEIKEGRIIVSRKKENKMARSIHGLTRALIANMVEGVSKGYSKTLELHGTGYRVKLEESKLVLRLGFSHPVVVRPSEGIKFGVKGEKEIIVSGIDKQLVSNTAASIRAIAPPEPYKGKGIRYRGEVVRKKPGKAAKVGVGETKYD